MKKIIVTLFICLGIALSSSPVQAANSNIEVIYLDNGDSIEITITEGPTTRASGTKTGSKTANYRSGGKIMWSVKVKGTFTYTGSSAKCIASSVSTTCPGSAWKIDSKSSSEKGNKAIATATAKQYQNGFCRYTKTVSVSLECSPSGKLS